VGSEDFFAKTRRRGETDGRKKKVREIGGKLRNIGEWFVRNMEMKDVKGRKL
jgi:hypothetical protein